MTKKIFVSTPMRGKEEYEIKDRMHYLFKLACAYLGEDCEMIDSLNPVYTDELQNNNVIDVAPLYLGASIKLLSQADLVIFDKYWMTAEGCRIEKQVCDTYRIKHIVEPELLGTFKEGLSYNIETESNY